ncbi:hypothetical protein J27TS7_37520 [Paenibacillus dendritiformis]|nr:hypothetical protein J27TS7_37520 [Paenibacillus dendritiformis]
MHSTNSTAEPPMMSVDSRWEAGDVRDENMAVTPLAVNEEARPQAKRITISCVRNRDGL